MVNMEAIQKFDIYMDRALVLKKYLGKPSVLSVRIPIKNHQEICNLHHESLFEDTHIFCQELSYAVQVCTFDALFLTAHQKTKL